MKDSFVFNKIYCIVLMSKRLKTKKKPSLVEREKKIDVFKKITIIQKETLPYQNITMSQIVCNNEE